MAATRPGALRSRLDLSHLQVLAGDCSPASARTLERGRVRLYVEGGAGPAELAAATWLRAELRLRPPGGLRNPGGRDRRPRLARSGIVAEARLVHPRAWWAEPGSMRGVPASALRTRVQQRLLREGRGGALLAALAVGAPGGLGPEVRDALGRAGLAHLLAVSGLHLAALGGLAFGVAWRVLPRARLAAGGRDTRTLAVALAVLAAAGYACLTGLQTPVLRAGLGLLALMLTFLRRRPTGPAQAIAGAGLLVLALEPAALFSPGAQLSFAATAGLLHAAARDRPDADPRLPFLRATLGASATAVAATAPLAAAHFGSAWPLGWLANLLAVPLTASVLLPLAGLAGLLAAVAPEHGSSILELLARAAESLLAAALAWSEASRGVAGAPIPDPGAVALVASGLLALAALRTRGLRLRMLLAAAAVAAPGCVRPAGPGPPPPRAVFLDVGQGDATLLQTRKAAVLVDAGVSLPGGPDLGRQAVVPALRALGVERLELAVASHADLDHRGGLLSVLREMPVARLWLPFGGRRERSFGELIREARRRGVVVQERGLGAAALELDGLRLVPLWPPAHPAGGARNDRSLVLRAELAGLRVMLPGDLEASGEASLLARVDGGSLRAEVLKLPHHGSRSSSTSAFLAAVSPGLAVASAPRFGRFGMPHPEVRQRLQRLGIALSWTGRDGAVLVPAGAVSMPAAGTQP